MRISLIIALLLFFNSAYAQLKYKSYRTFKTYLSQEDDFIPKRGLKLLVNPGAQMITGASGNWIYPDLTLGSELIDNGDFSNFHRTPDGNTVAAWVFDPLYASNVGGDSIHKDLTANNNDLTWAGWTGGPEAYSIIADSAEADPNYSGGNVLYFNGVDEYLTIQNTDVFEYGTGDMSIEAWVFDYNYDDGNEYIFSYYLNVNDNLFFQYSGNDILFRCEIGNVPFINMYSTTNGLTNGNWHHVAVTVDNSDTTILYIDGSSVATSVVASLVKNHDFDAGAGIDLFVGAYTGASFFVDGYISEVRYYDKALTAQEVQTHYGLGKGWNFYSVDRSDYVMNNDFGQQIGRDGGLLSRIKQIPTTVADKLHSLDYDVTEDNLSSLYLYWEAVPIWGGNPTAKSYKIYNKTRDTATDLRWYPTLDAQTITLDNIGLKQVTNASVPDSIAINYAFSDTAGQDHGYPIADLEDDQPSHPYAWDFNGVDQYVGFGDVLESERTISKILFAWVKTSSASNIKIMDKQDGAVDGSQYTGFNLFFNAGNIIFQNINTITTNHAKITTNSTYNDDVWHFICAIDDGSSDADNYKIYVDGSNIAVTKNIDNLSATILNNVSFVMGSVSAGSGNYFDGSIGLSGIYIFDGANGAPSSLPPDYATSIIQKIYDNTSAYYVDD